MAGLIIQDYKAFMQSSYDLISLGIKPSGSPHIGSVATFVAALDQIEKHSSTKINLQIMDLDFDMHRGDRFVPFVHQVFSGKSARESLRSDLEEVVDVMGGIYSSDIADRIQIDYFSEFLLNPATLNQFLSILVDPKKTSAINRELFDARLTKRIPISGICPNCHTSNSAFAWRIFNPGDIEKKQHRLELLKSNVYQLEPAILEKAISSFTQYIAEFSRKVNLLASEHGGEPQYLVKSKCQNDSCSVDNYVFDLRSGFYNVHYLVDPIRDEILMPGGKTAHVFGGDYAAPHGTQAIPKVERVRNALNAVGSTDQDFFIGPLINYHGKKMGKSEDSVAFKSLKYSQQKLVVEYIHELYVRGNREIDYNDLAKRL